MLISTLNVYSPRAYEYTRGVFTLLHTNSLIERTFSINCKPGFFIDVFQNLNSQIDQNPTDKECFLLCDALNISNLYIIIL